MAQSTRLVTAIKRELKRRRIAYRELAAELELAESTVKQMFASGNLTLKRLDRICAFLGLDLADLVVLAEREHREERAIERLTLEQEEALVSDPKLLLVAYCVLNHWRFEDIVARYRLSDTECIRLVARLDRMRFAELLPGNRIRALISANFGWHPEGPITRYFRQEVEGQFLAGRFDEPHALKLVRLGDVSTATLDQLSSRLEAVGQLFDDLAREDCRLPEEQRTGAIMLAAVRHWVFDVFADLERTSSSEDKHALKYKPAPN